MKKPIFWQRILNVFSGLTQCTGGILLIYEGQTAVGVTLICAGITKMTAHEIQVREVKKIKTVLSDGNLNGKN